MQFFELAAAKGSSNIPKNEPALSHAAVEAAAAAERRPRPINKAKGCSQVEPYPSGFPPMQQQENVSGGTNRNSPGYDRLSRRHSTMTPQQAGDDARFVPMTNFLVGADGRAGGAPGSLPLMTPRTATNHLSAMFGLQPTLSGSFSQGAAPFDRPQVETLGASGQTVAGPQTQPAHLQQLQTDAMVDEEMGTPAEGGLPSEENASLAFPSSADIVSRSADESNSGATRRTTAPATLNLGFLSQSDDCDLKMELPSVSPGSYGTGVSGESGLSRPRKRSLSARIPGPNGPGIPSATSTPSPTCEGFGLASPANRKVRLERARSGALAATPTGGSGWSTWMPLGSAALDGDGGDAAAEYLSYSPDQFAGSADGLMTPGGSGFMDGGNQFTPPSPTHAGLLAFSARGLLPKTSSQDDGLSKATCPTDAPADPPSRDPSQEWKPADEGTAPHPPTPDHAL